MISVCLIVKNEEPWIEACLQSLTGLASEIIVVDTGSTDGTREIASRYTSNVFSFTWTGDFSEARNFSCEKATQPWILILDADEVIAEKDRSKILALTENPMLHAYRIPTRNYVHDANVAGFKPSANEYTEEKGALGYFESSKVRLFQSGRGYRFQGRVHEMVDPTIPTSLIQNCDIPVHHYGCLPEEVERKQKARAYQQALEEKVREESSNPKALFELGIQYLNNGKTTEAVATFERVLKQADAPSVYAHLGHAYFQLGKNSEALSTFQRGMQRYPSDPDLLFNYGSVLTDMQAWEKALKIFEKIVILQPSHFAAERALGFCLLRLQKFEGAVSHLKKAISLFADFNEARLDLAVAYANQGNVAGAKVEVDRVLLKDPQNIPARRLYRILTQGG